MWDKIRTACAILILLLCAFFVGRFSANGPASEAGKGSISVLETGVETGTRTSTLGAGEAVKGREQTTAIRTEVVGSRTDVEESRRALEVGSDHLENAIRGIEQAESILDEAGARTVDN